MYGFVNYALEQLVLRNFGEEKWEEIKRVAGVEVKGNYIIRMIYDDAQTYDLVVAATKVLQVPAEAVLELYGAFFFEFCEESGYDKILHVLGSSPKDFLQNLDALHDHLASIYPGMKAPSFRCTTREKDGATILHYYSDRPGLEHIVIGLVKTVAKKLHKTEVEVEMVQAKVDGNDHVQFAIIDKNLKDPGLAHKVHDLYAAMFSAEPKISPYSFCKMFPFHIMIDENLVVHQLGTAMWRLVPQLAQPGCKITDVFDIIRPHIELKYNQIMAQINSVFVLAIKDPNAPATKGKAADHGGHGGHGGGHGDKLESTRMKGQMLWVKESKMLLFLCSPSVISLDDLNKRNIFLGDIPLHDATRDLAVMSEQFGAEYKLAQNLEILTDRLQQAYAALEDEKKKTDKLIYSILPPSVAQELRHGREVAPMKFEAVTIMFCGVKGFSEFCAKHAGEPMKIVDLLNDVFTRFDTQAEKIKEVYKVETVGDKYMAVSGLPEKCDTHAKCMAKLGLAMLDAMVGAKNCDGEKIVAGIGLHSGEVVTGVIGKRMPRYCLFGNTVNLTSRCETTGTKGRINVSESTHERLTTDPLNMDPEFVLTFKGSIPMKGKPRPMEMYYLDRAGGSVASEKAVDQTPKQQKKSKLCIV